MTALLIHGLLAILLFFLVNWIGQHSTPFGYGTLSLHERVEEAPAFNLLFRVGAPQVYLVLAAALFSAIGLFQFATDLWRVTALYIGVRIGFNLLMGRAVLINWRTQIMQGVIATGISYWLSHAVLTSADRALPDAGDLTTELRLVVILFVYHTINRLSFGVSQQSARQEEYITRRVRHFRSKFGAIIERETTDRWTEALVYAVLLFEDFNRPAVARFVESFVLFPFGFAKTLGPMQVRVDHRVTDEEGVRLGAQYVVSLYPGAEALVLQRYPGHNAESGQLPSWLREEIGRQVAVMYNPDGKYADEVRALYEKTLRRYYSGLSQFATAEIE